MGDTQQAVEQAVRLLTDGGLLEWKLTGDEHPSVVAQTKMRIVRAAYGRINLEWGTREDRQFYTLSSDTLRPEMKRLTDTEFSDPESLIRPGG